LQIVRKNLGLKALALALAIVGWAYLRFAGNPLIATPQFQQLTVPISVANLPFGYVAQFADNEATITIATKRGDPAINPEDVKAVLDLANKGAGVFNVPVQLVAPDLVVQSLNPATVTLTVERIEQRSYPISAYYVGGHPSDIVVSRIRVLPASALVRAPNSVLAKVAAVNADVVLPNEPKSLDEMVRPVAVDASGAEVAGLTVTPNLVRVQGRFVTGNSTTK
jgi:YbbR domain-containing protein